jgi:hypothetical protein
MKFPATRPLGHVTNHNVLAFPLNNRLPETPEPLAKDQACDEGSIETAGRDGTAIKRPIRRKTNFLAVVNRNPDLC